MAAVHKGGLLDARLFIVNPHMSLLQSFFSYVCLWPLGCMYVLLLAIPLGSGMGFGHAHQSMVAVASNKVMMITIDGYQKLTGIAIGHDPTSDRSCGLGL